MLIKVEWLFDGTFPEVVFYDQACKLTKHMHDVQYVKLDGILWKVDRFHYSTHSEHDEWCKLHCCPELPAVVGDARASPAADDVRVDPRLWQHDGERWHFIWKSSMAETTLLCDVSALSSFHCLSVLLRCSRDAYGVQNV